MGYYSQFSLTLHGANGQADYTIQQDEVLADLFEQVQYASYPLCKDGSPNETAKWYSIVEDMTAFSTRHPSVLFKFEVEGEESGDLYHLYFLNGQVQKAKAVITYPPFDTDLLRKTLR